MDATQGHSAARKARENWRGNWFLLALVAVATALFTPAADAQPVSPPTAQSAAVALNGVRDNVHVITTQLTAVTNAVSAVNREGRPCPAGTWTVPVRLAPGVVVNACTNRQPRDCDRNDIRGIYERWWGTVQNLRGRVTRIEELYRTLLACTDQASCLQAAQDMRDEIEAANVTATEALGNSQQIASWISQRLIPHLGEISTALTGLRTDVDDLKTRTSNLETWRTEVAPQIAEALRLSRQNATDIADARAHHLTVGLTAQGLYMDGPGIAPSAGAVLGGVDIIGRPSPHFVLTGSFLFGYGQTVDGSRGGFAMSIHAGPGYEWPGTGRILLQGGFTRVESSRWHETTMLLTGGFRVRAEYDVTPVVTLFGGAGWESGNGINLRNGADVDASRFQLFGGISARLGNW